MELDEEGKREKNLEQVETNKDKEGCGHSVKEEIKVAVIIEKLMDSFDGKEGGGRWREALNKLKKFRIK